MKIFNYFSLFIFIVIVSFAFAPLEGLVNVYGANAAVQLKTPTAHFVRSDSAFNNKHFREIFKRTEDFDKRIEKRINGAGTKFVKDEIIVKFKGDKKPFRTLKVPAGETLSRARALASRPDVEFAEPNYIAEAYWSPNDPYYGFQWHMDNPQYGGVEAESAWDALGAPGAPGSGAVVAVVDTGIAYQNYRRGRERYYRAPDLRDTCFVDGYDFIEGDTHPNDDNSHGTHVAGTIAQSTNNGTGVAGLAFKTCLMPVKVLDRNGYGTYAEVADGIRFAADNGADVINLSLGGPSPSQVLEDAVAYAYNKGVTIIAAAGNDGTGSVGYPAAYDSYVIAVGATRFDEMRAPYSSYGASLDIMAPGGDLNADQNGDGYGDGVLQQTFNPNTKNRKDFGYWFFQGTSMAAPHVSGVASLIIANGNAAGPVQVRAALEETADDLGPAGRDDGYGWGIVNAAAALGWSSGPPVPVDNPPAILITSPADGATASSTVYISANASDDNGVSKVDFYVDNNLIASDTSAPYETNWDSTTAADGQHSIKATAVDSALQESSDSVAVFVDNINDAPIADAGPDQSGHIGDIFSFNASGSSDPDGTIISYKWDFGDGATASGINAVHAYSATGTYAVMLTVIDDGGLSASDTAIVSVSDAPVIVSVFEDSFEYGAGAGWGGLWNGDYQNDWFVSQQRATDGVFSAEVDGRAKNAAITSIAISLAGRTSATISFDWLIERGLDRGEYIAFDVSKDGGATWVQRARLRGNKDKEDVWHSVNIDETDVMSGELMIRFRGKMSKSSEDANVDNVRVVAK